MLNTRNIEWITTRINVDVKPREDHESDDKGRDNGYQHTLDSITAEIAPVNAGVNHGG
jgi:hypothetical protein